MKSNLDVWAIQYLPSELKTALDNIKTDNDLILYTNLLCKFNLGNEAITSRQFDTALYSEENDVLVLLMRGGEATADDIRDYLEKKGFLYHEVCFATPVDSHKDDLSIPELWFAREEYVVQDALEDSIARNVKREFEYYPFLEGNLDLDYGTNIYGDEDLEQNKHGDYPVDGRLFRGLIRLQDKVILLIYQGEQRNVTAMQVGEIAKRNGFACTILENQDFSLAKMEKKKLVK